MQRGQALGGVRIEADYPVEYLLQALQRKVADRHPERLG